MSKKAPDMSTKKKHVGATVANGLIRSSRLRMSPQPQPLADRASLLPHPHVSSFGPSPPPPSSASLLFSSRASRKKRAISPSARMIRESSRTTTTTTSQQDEEAGEEREEEKVEEGEEEEDMVSSDLIASLRQWHIRPVTSRRSGVIPTPMQIKRSAPIPIPLAVKRQQPPPPKRVRLHHNVIPSPTSSPSLMEATTPEEMLLLSSIAKVGTKAPSLYNSLTLQGGRNHLVLDIDGTLISSNSSATNIDARPGLGEFLDNCFALFETVSIWTAAQPEWFDIVWRDLLKPLVQDRGHAFHFIWTHATCATRQRPGRAGIVPDDQGYTVDFTKPLRRVWHSFPGCTRYNVLIFDDNEITFVDNPHNAVHIPLFQGAQDDTALAKLGAWLPLASRADNVRMLEKPWVL